MKRKEISEAAISNRSAPATVEDGQRKSEETPAKKPRIEHEATTLKPVSHPSHGSIPGRAFVWGTGDCGQLGLGEDITMLYPPFPINVANHNVLQICCGGMHTVMLLEDGTIWSWGVNDEGALGRNAGGELWESLNLPDIEYPLEPSEIPAQVRLPVDAGPIVQVAGGDSHTVVLTELGSVYGWGTYRDNSGVVGFTPGVRIQATAALVYAPTTRAQQIVQIASGNNHTLALAASGEVLSWGIGEQGQLGRPGEGLHMPAVVPLPEVEGVDTRVAVVACGPHNTFAVTRQGQVFACGLNNRGQLGLPQFAPHLVMTHVPLLKDVKGIAAGDHHTLALTHAGTVMSFGNPVYGALGRADVDVEHDAELHKPVWVDGVDGIAMGGAAAGAGVSGCFSSESGCLLCWGANTSCQLGKPEEDEADELLPRQVEEVGEFRQQKVVQLEFGGQHAACLAVPRT